MSDVVVDSSLVAKRVLPEADSDKAHEVLASSVASGHRLTVLDLAFPEAASAIWKRHRQKLISSVEAEAFLDALLRCPVEVESATRFLKPALQIAIRYDRSIYDALFVALAQALNCNAVTADEPLHSAIRADFPNIVLLRNWTS